MVVCASPQDATTLGATATVEGLDELQRCSREAPILGPCVAGRAFTTAPRSEPSRGALEQRLIRGCHCDVVLCYAPFCWCAWQGTSTLPVVGGALGAPSASTQELRAGLPEGLEERQEDLWYDMPQADPERIPRRQPGEQPDDVN